METKKSDTITFDDIVSSIPFAQFKASFLSWTEKDLQNKIKVVDDPSIRAQLQCYLQNATEQLSDDDRALAVSKSEDPLYNIAYFARAISQMHPGWGQDGFETQDFQSEIVKLYQKYRDKGLTCEAEVNQLLTDLWGIAATTLPDNHFRIQAFNKNLSKYMRPFKDKEKTLAEWSRERPLKVRHPEHGNVGKNVGYDTQQLTRILMCTNQVASQGVASLVVGERTVGSQTFGVLGIPDCTVHWGTSQEKTEMEKLNCLVQTLKKNYQNWDGIIIDVRGNYGGTSIALDEIAQTLCGEKVPYCLESKKRHTKEAELREVVSTHTQEQPKWTPRSFQKQGNQPVLVLMDGQTASSAEAIVPMLQHYKGATFIGENTMGCCQYGGVKPVPLPCGGILHIGTVFRTYEKGMVECVGHRPDIECSGRDALQVAFEQIENNKTLNQTMAHNTSHGRI